jgi:hypothetical protein
MEVTETYAYDAFGNAVAQTQEFEANFETLGVGRAYYAFDRAHTVKNVAFNSQKP